MRIISKKALLDFWKIHPNAQVSLESWYKVISKTAFATFTDVKKSFNTIDYVDPYTVFDVGGNNFRIISAIHYDKQNLYIRHVLTHKEYDKWSKDYRKRKNK